ncbi:toll/interleukin-1 receptor domain-containing protein [Bradyrhizobium sp. UFLA06-06]
MATAFISYSHRDEKALERLHIHLATLRREGAISAWYDREILAGDDFDIEIDAALSKSEIFLALVSPDFLASSYCYDQEVSKALERHAQGTLRVVPIVIEPCDWKSTPLGKLKALPKDGKPISTWTNENIAYLDVAMELRRIASDQPPAQQYEPGQKSTAPAREGRRYRIKKEFDSFDRDDFRHKAFLAIETFFRSSVDELNQISELIRARYEKISNLAFSCTVLNKANGGEAHITVRADTEHFGEDISYAFSRRAASNTANGFIYVRENEYELYLQLSNFSGNRTREAPLTAEQVSDSLWREFTGHAGIDHE